LGLRPPDQGTPSRTLTPVTLEGRRHPGAVRQPDLGPTLSQFPIRSEMTRPEMFAQMWRPTGCSSFGCSGSSAASGGVHPWSRYFNKADKRQDKRRRRAPPALPQPQEAGVGPSGAGPSGLGPTATAPPAAPDGAGSVRPRDQSPRSHLRSRKRS